MSHLLTTFSIAFALFFLALMGLMISWLVKGETFKGGSCGRRPKTPKDKNCGTDVSCVLCNPTGKKKVKTTQDEVNSPDDSTH